MLPRMSLRRTLSVVALSITCLTMGLAGSGFLATAQDRVAGKPAAKQRVAFSAAFEPATAAPGSTVQLKVTATPLPDHYIYSLTQGDGGKPTTIQLSDFVGFEAVEAPVFQATPEPTIEMDPGVGAEPVTLEKHKGETVFTTTLKLTDTAPAGQDATVALKITYGVCDKRQCYFPPALKLSATLPVSAGEPSAATPVATSEKPTTTAPVDVVAAAPVEKVDIAAEEQAAPPPAVGELDKSKGLPLFLISAFLAGFAALLTPCVFPMVPITVTFFLKQAEQEHHKPLPLAIVYCLGIVGTFTGLGLVMSILFDATKLTQVANDPWLNLVIAGVLVFFALNLLGLFEIRMPGWLLTYTAGQESRGGYVGVLFMALTFTLTSFTCTFAFAGGLLVAASQGDRLWPILGLLSFSLAFSLPFFFLALFPSMLKKLPKSGGWMNLFKVSMGLVELGAAFKFFSVADQTWNPTPLIFDQELVLSAWMVIAICAGIYLLGLFRTDHDTPTESIGAMRMVAAMSFLGLAAYLAVGLLSPQKPGGQLWQNIHAFLPPKFEGSGVNQELGPVLEHDGLEYALDIRKALEVAIAQKKPLFIDFTGVNCINCRKMERGTLANRAIHERLKKFIRVQAFLDTIPEVTDKAFVNEVIEVNQALAQEWYGDVSMPSYAVVAPSPEALKDARLIQSRVAGLTDVRTFAEFLDTGFDKAAKVQARGKMLSQSAR